MKSHIFYFVLGIASCWSIYLLPAPNQQAGEGDAVEKIAELEDRVSRLESIVFSTSRLDSTEAQRRLQNAKQAFEHSRKLRKKGFITEAQLQNDEFAVKQAEQELQLALGKTNEAKLGADLVLMTAEQDLLQAQRNLEYTKKLAAKGFATTYDVQREERLIRRLELRVANAKERVKSFEPKSKSDSQSLDPESDNL